MSDSGRIITESAVRFERRLPGPIERVWEHLTSDRHLPDWFGGRGMSFTLEPREGGQVSLMGGHIRGLVTQFKPPRLLSYTWNVLNPGETESAYPESYVTIELQPDGDHVQLVLTHRPIPDVMTPFTLLGWHTFLDLLAAMLRGDPLADAKALMERYGNFYGAPGKP